MSPQSHMKKTNGEYSVSPNNSVFPNGCLEIHLSGPLPLEGSIIFISIAINSESKPNFYSNPTFS